MIPIPKPFLNYGKKLHTLYIELYMRYVKL